MSLLPYAFGYDNWSSWPSRLLDQNFGLALTPDDILTVVAPPLITGEHIRPWRQLAELSGELGSNIKADKDKFQVNVDVQHFSPEEVSVWAADGWLWVEGSHEERRDDHGFVSRKFLRRYALPEGCRSEDVQSRLSSDGVLTVTAPRHLPSTGKGERAVPIQHTGPVRKEIKHVHDEHDTRRQKKDKKK